MKHCDHGKDNEGNCMQTYEQSWPPSRACTNLRVPSDNYGQKTAGSTTKQPPPRSSTLACVHERSKKLFGRQLTAAAACRRHRKITNH